MSAANPIGLLTEQDIARLADAAAGALVASKEALSTPEELATVIGRALRREMEIETGRRMDAVAPVDAADSELGQEAVLKRLRARGLVS